MTKVSGLLCVLILITSLLACKGENDTSNSSSKRNLKLNEHDLPGILKRGKIIVLAENSATSYFIYKGKKLGFEYEILKEFAEDLGVAIEVKLVNDLTEMHEKLNAGEGDFIACNYTVTMDRKEDIEFTEPIIQSPQVLIQRVETDPKLIKQHPLLTSQLELARKKIFVWEGSSYYQRLINLQQEIGDTIFIRPTQSHEGVEELIEMVSNGQIDYTVCEKNVADINCRFFDNIDASLKISFDQKIALGLNKKAPILKKKFNEWLNQFKKNELYAFIKKKYFTVPEKEVDENLPTVKIRKGMISPFDSHLQKEASKYNFEWHLLAAIIYQESKFNPNAQGFGGAYGLMQFMPGTGPQYNVYPSSTAEQQITGGMKYINRLLKIWSKIPDPEQRYKFMLASYNAGPGHVIDAYKLAEKHGLNPKVWDNNVAEMVGNLGKREFYTDEVVKSGAFRGQRTVNYVASVMSKYHAFSGK